MRILIHYVLMRKCIYDVYMPDVYAVCVSPVTREEKYVTDIEF